jgi:hypothetical protein
MTINQYSLRRLFLFVTMAAIVVGLSMALYRWANNHILKIERDAMRADIVEYELDDPKSSLQLLNSEYARRLLGDEEIQAQRAEHYQRTNANTGRAPAKVQR